MCYEIKKAENRYFNLHSCAVPGSHPECHITFSWQDSSGLWQFVILSLFLTALTVLRSIDYIVLFLSIEICPMLFLRLEKVTEARLPVHHIISRVHIINMIYECWCSPGHLSGGVSARFACCATTLPHCTLWASLFTHLRSGVMIPIVWVLYNKNYSAPRSF